MAFLGDDSFGIDSSLDVGALEKKRESDSPAEVELSSDFRRSSYEIILCIYCKYYNEKKIIKYIIEAAQHLCHIDDHWTRQVVNSLI